VPLNGSFLSAFCDPQLLGSESLQSCLFASFKASVEKRTPSGFFLARPTAALREIMQHFSAGRFVRD
jgi:hypothetical protein